MIGLMEEVVHEPGNTSGASCEVHGWSQQKNCCSMSAYTLETPDSADNVANSVLLAGRSKEEVRVGERDSGKMADLRRVKKVTTDA